MFIGYHPEVEELFEHKKENNMTTDSCENTLDPDKIPETFDELSKEADPQLSMVLIQTEILGLTLILQSKGIINADELKASTNFAYEEMMLPVLKVSLNTTGGDNVENEEKDENV